MMMLGWLGVLAPPPVTLKFEVFQADRSVGEATLRQAIEADGTKTVELRMVLGPKEAANLVTQSSITKADGTVARKYQEIKAPGAAPKFVIISFSDGKANLVEDEKGQRQVSSYEKPVDLPPATNLSEFWLLRDIPTRGDSVEFCDFDYSRKEWRTVRTTYLGLTRIPGIDDPVHKVMSKTIMDGKERLVSVFSDAKGNPVRIVDTAGFRLERLNSISIK